MYNKKWEPTILHIVFDYCIPVEFILIKLLNFRFLSSLFLQHFFANKFDGHLKSNTEIR